MSDPMHTPRLGLPAHILYMLTPRHAPVETPPRHDEAPGATFTPSQPEVRSGDEQLFNELRMLAELHRAHQAAGSDQSS